jgi:hypothetical protein
MRCASWRQLGSAVNKAMSSGFESIRRWSLTQPPPECAAIRRVPGELCELGYASRRWSVESARECISSSRHSPIRSVRAQC